MSNFEIIENYLKGKLEGDALKAFESRLASDSTFASEVEEHKAVQDMIFMKGLLETRTKLDNIRKIKTAQNPGGNGNSFWKGALLIISLLVLSGVGYLLFQKKNTSDNVTTNNIADTSSIVDNSKENNETENPVKEFSKNNTKANDESKVIEKNKDEKTPTDSGAVTSITKTEPIKETNLVPDKKNQEHPPVDKKTLCEDIHIKANIRTEESCKISSGTVSISNVSEGKAPYLFSFDHAEFSKSTFYNMLAPGEYPVVIKDAHGCIAKFSAKVGSKSCEEKHIFAPDRGETWKFPIPEGGTCKIQILDAAGATVYEAPIINGYPSEWDGTGKNITYTKAGAYLYFIHCSDGSQQQGTVTIIR